MFFLAIDNHLIIYTEILALNTSFYLENGGKIDKDHVDW